MGTMIAKYPGRCPMCSQAVRVGETIDYRQMNGRGVAYHPACAPASKAPPAPASYEAEERAGIQADARIPPVAGLPDGVDLGRWSPALLANLPR